MARDIFAFILISLICIDRYLSGNLILPWLSILFAFSIGLILREHRTQRRQEFLNQLKSHRKEFRAGGTIVVDQMLLRYHTVLTTYHVNVGGIISIVRIPSLYGLVNEGDHGESLVYSICSLITGWWALPEGPIVTIKDVQQNLRGGEQITVAVLIDSDLLKLQQKEGEQNALLDQAAQLSKKQNLASKHYRSDQNPNSLDHSYADNNPGTLLGPRIGKSLNERIDEIDRAKPPGIVLIESLKRKYQERNARQNLKMRLKESTGEVPQNKLTNKIKQKSNPNQALKSRVKPKVKD